MPLKPMQPLVKLERQDSGSKTWYEATEVGTGFILTSFRYAKDGRAWVAGHNRDAVRAAYDEVHVLRPWRVHAAWTYLWARRQRAGQERAERGAQATLAF